MTVQQIQSVDIYHGLPVYPPSLTNLTAIITGANGISGHHMLRVLAASPHRWTKIYCLSRRPPYIPEGADGLPSNVTHIPIDFLESPTRIAQLLSSHNVTHVDYVFFFAYIQPPPAPRQPQSQSGPDTTGQPRLWSNSSEMVRLNSALLSNFLSALRLTNPPLLPKRIVLQTGAKHYGGHLGLTKQPSVEDSPRISETEFEPNFYYAQEDILFDYCRQTQGKTGWNAVMPGPILGAVPDAAMNFAYGLAVYGTVCRRLGREMVFPGEVGSWQAGYSVSSAGLDAWFEEWVALQREEEGEGGGADGGTGGNTTTANQRFNICDSSSFTWELVWPHLGRWFGVTATGPEADDHHPHHSHLDDLYPLSRPPPFPKPPRGYGSAPTIRSKFSLVSWAQQPDVIQAWNELAKEHDLAPRYRDLAGEAMNSERLFAFLDRTLCRGSALMLSMDKSRALGWHGFVSTIESLRVTMDEFVGLKMIPPLPL